MEKFYIKTDNYEVLKAFFLSKDNMSSVVNDELLVIEYNSGDYDYIEVLEMFWNFYKDNVDEYILYYNNREEEILATQSREENECDEIMASECQVFITQLPEIFS